jgi:hypothetical protein
MSAATNYTSQDPNKPLSNLNKARHTPDNHADIKNAIFLQADILIGKMAVYIARTIQEVVPDDAISF